MKIKFDISKGFVKTKEINSKEKSKNKNKKGVQICIKKYLFY